MKQKNIHSIFYILKKFTNKPNNFFHIYLFSKSSKIASRARCVTYYNAPKCIQTEKDSYIIKKGKKGNKY